VVLHCLLAGFFVFCRWRAAWNMISQAVSLIGSCGILEDSRFVLDFVFGGPMGASLSACVGVLSVRSRFLIGDASAYCLGMRGCEIWLCCLAGAKTVRCCFFVGEILIGWLCEMQVVVERFDVVGNLESVCMKLAIYMN
jgi:hypothetical protein